MKHKALLVLLTLTLTGCAGQVATVIPETEVSSVIEESTTETVEQEETQVQERAQVEIDYTKFHSDSECYASYSKDVQAYLFETPGTKLFSVTVGQEFLDSELHSSEDSGVTTVVSSDDESFHFTVTPAGTEEYDAVNAYSAFIFNNGENLQIQYTVAADQVQYPVNIYLRKVRVYDRTLLGELQTISEVISQVSYGTVEATSDSLSFTLTHEEHLDVLELPDMTIYYDTLNNVSMIPEYEVIFEDTNGIDQYFGFMGKSILNSMQDLSTTIAEYSQPILQNAEIKFILPNKINASYQEDHFSFSCDKTNYTVNVVESKHFELPDSSTYSLRTLPDFFYTIENLPKED